LGVGEKLDTKDFLANDRAAYVAKLRKPVAKNAGFVGKSKFAQQVNASIGSALEQAEAERKGTDRLSAGKKAIVLASDAGLQVVYRVGRKEVSESFSPFLNSDQAREAIDEATTPLALATSMPDIYWHMHYHYDGDVEGALKTNGLLQNKRRR
jgi:hypothetical protein